MSTYSDNYLKQKQKGKTRPEFVTACLLKLAVKIARREGRAPRLGIDGQHLLEWLPNKHISPWCGMVPP